jgi:cytochrome c-type biogenesis protein CcmF
VLLITVFVRSDMSVLLVAENSHSLKPLLYKIAGRLGKS